MLYINSLLQHLMVTKQVGLLQAHQQSVYLPSNSPCISHIDAEFYCQHVKQILDDLQCTAPLSELKQFSSVSRNNSPSASYWLNRWPNVSTMCVIRQSVQSAICSRNLYPGMSQVQDIAGTPLSALLYSSVFGISQRLPQLHVGVRRDNSVPILIPSDSDEEYLHTCIPHHHPLSKYMHLYLRHTTASRSCKDISS